MTRGLYIAVAVVGLVLVLLALFAAVVSIAPPGYTRVADIAEAAVGGVGILMAWGGLVMARAAGEYAVSAGGGRRKRNAVAAAKVAAAVKPELAFDCPGCGRTYRSTDQMAGRPFACRVCDARFTIPRPTQG